MAVSVSIGAADADYTFHNLGLSDDECVDNVISLLTLDEKISLLPTSDLARDLR
ncbi:MAG: hypothetical protein K2L30_01885 [Duncaniella sp.]|nr:hypothetical protein [Duncaniella sp.]